MFATISTDFERQPVITDYKNSETEKIYITAAPDNETGTEQTTKQMASTSPTFTQTWKERLISKMVAKPIQTAAFIALLFAGLGFLLAKKLTTGKRK